MKKKIGLRIFLLTLLPLLLVFSSGVFAVFQNSRAVVAERLKAEADLLSHLLAEEEDIAALQNWKDHDAFRITVLREDGTVLFESNTAEKLENHAGREEVIGALTGNPHTVERYSSTFGCRMTYYAVRSVQKSGEPILIRLAIKSAEITPFLWVTLPLLLFALCISLAVSLFFSERFSGMIARRISCVADSLRSLNRDDYHPLAVDSSEPELFAVYLEINELSAKTHDYMETLRTEKEKLSVVLDNVSQGIIALGADGGMVFVNRSALSLFGGAADLHHDLLYLIDDSALCTRIREWQGEEAFTYTYGEKELSVTVRRVTGGHLAGQISSIVILTDITREIAVAREKSDFFANASHELKTPLTVMQGNAELILAKPNLDEGTRKQVMRIHEEALRMSGLILDMLRLSDLELQKEGPDARVTLELRPVCEEVVSELSAPITAGELTVSVTGNGAVTADPKKIYELVSNLVANAVNYNKKGGSVAVTIRVQDGSTVLCVKDSGIGIPREHLSRVCERFYRVDKSHSRKTGGTGLGLAIVKHICALYGAELKLESEVDVGTTVTVRFPTQKEE